MAVKPSLKNGAKEVKEVAILKIFWLFMIDAHSSLQVSS